MNSITNYKYIFLIIALIYFIVNLLFIISLEDAIIFDDSASLRDIQRYSSFGVSKETLINHINTAAPGSYIWMAKIGNLVNGDNFSRHISIYFSWVILLLFLLIFFIKTDIKEIILYCVFFIFLSPHLSLAMVSMLTEGPSMMFALCGSYLWISSYSKKNSFRNNILLSIFSSILIGLSIASRQYYLALVPAMFILTIFYFIKNKISDFKEISFRSISLLISLIPIICLFFIWGDLTSQMMQNNLSYPDYQAKVGINLTRAISCIFYIGIYLTPICLLALKNNIKSYNILYSLLITFLIYIFKFNLLGNGPIMSLLQIASSKNILISELIYFILLNLSFFSIFYFLESLFRTNVRNYCNPYFIFSASFILFFILEQLFVGGNIPFFERYMLQILPFIGILSYFRFDNYFRKGYFLHLTLIFLISQYMIWRYLI